MFPSQPLTLRFKFLYVLDVTWFLKLCFSHLWWNLCSTWQYTWKYDRAHLILVELNLQVSISICSVSCCTNYWYLFSDVLPSRFLELHILDHWGTTFTCFWISFLKERRTPKRLPRRYNLPLDLFFFFAPHKLYGDMVDIKNWKFDILINDTAVKFLVFQCAQIVQSVENSYTSLTLMCKYDL